MAAGGMWEVDAVDALAQAEAAAEEGRGAALPPIVNNPESLPARGVWTVRAYETEPYLLEGRRFVLDVYTLVSDGDPLRVYMYSEGTVWLAPKPFDASDLRPEDHGRHCARPTVANGLAFGALHAFRCRGSREGEIVPLSRLWQALGNESAQLLWERLQLAAAVATLSLVAPQGGVSSSSGYSTAFQLLSLQVAVDAALTPTVLSAVPTPPLPEQGGTGGDEPMEEPTQRPAGWHAGLIGALASDVLNLTGASLRTERKTLYRHLSDQLLRVLKARPLARRHTMQRGGGGRAKGKPGASRTSGRGSERMKVRKDEGVDAACKYTMMVNASYMRRIRAMRAEQADDAADGEPRRELEERCLSLAEVSLLAHADVEWYWRGGFRRIVPGVAEEIRVSLRPLRSADEVYAAYLNRWPKEEPRRFPLFAYEG